jgi:ComF family protein
MINPLSLGRRLSTGLEPWLLPPVCLVCGQAARPGLDCCQGCEADLPLIRASCQRCALELVRDVDLCGRCSRRLPAFDRAFAGFAYRGSIERLVQRFKFRHDLAAGRVLAGLLARRLAEQQVPRPDLVVPVPLHWRRRLRRGFNQAELLCADLSRHFGGLPWHPVVERHRATVAQSELPADRRGGNVRGAFRVRSGVVPTHVALVDDVMTTGATLDACARSLRQAGVQRIDVWVVARA